MQLFPVFLSTGSGRQISHELQSWSFPAEGGRWGSPRTERAAAASRSYQFYSITVALREGPRKGAAGSQTFGSQRRPLLRDAPSPFAASPRLLRCCAARHPPRRALRAAPSPWKFPPRPGTAILPLASRPHPPGPSLPTPPGEEKNSVSSVNSAARRSLPLRPGLRRQTPRDWWKSRSPPPSPTRKIASFDQFRSAKLAQRAHPSLLPLFSGDRGRQ
nr:uncharacterized protein LOC117794842 [Marmota flaviventris]